MFDKIFMGLGFLAIVVGGSGNELVSVGCGVVLMVSSFIGLAKEEIIQAIKENK